jgi:hypothetical protein
MSFLRHAIFGSARGHRRGIAVNSKDRGRSLQGVARNAIGECKLIDGRWTCWPTNLDAATLAEIQESEVDIYKIAVEHFRHDLTQFWNHSSFFALLQTALISVAMTSLRPYDPKQITPIFTAKEIAAVVGVVGLALALFWLMVAWRRSVLIQKWRQQVLHLDGRVNRHAIYQRVEPNVGPYWWSGPTKLTVALPIVICAFWLALLAGLACVYVLPAVLAVEVGGLAYVVLRSWNEVRQVHMRSRFKKR